MRSMKRRAAGVAAAVGLAALGLPGCQTFVGGMTLPSPRYLEHYPQYFAPDPSFPLPREQASMEDPDGAFRNGVGGAAGVAPVAPAGPQPAGGAPVNAGGPQSLPR